MTLALHATLAAHAFFARRRIRKLGLDKLLAAPPEIAKPYDPIQMLWLYRDILARNPRHVVELGCGYSTIVIRAALRENGAGTLTSIDAQEDWAEAWRERIPAELASFGTIEVCPVKQIGYQGTKAHCYDRPAPAALDYLFVDGPSPRSIPGWSGPPMSADPLLWESSFREEARIVIEGRNQNAAFLLRSMSPDWHRQENPPLRWISFERGLAA